MPGSASAQPAVAPAFTESFPAQTPPWEDFTALVLAPGAKAEDAVRIVKPPLLAPASTMAAQPTATPPDVALTLPAPTAQTPFEASQLPSGSTAQAPGSSAQHAVLTPPASTINQPAIAPAPDITALPVASSGVNPFKAPSIAESFPPAPGPDGPETLFSGPELEQGGTLPLPEPVQSPWEGHSVPKDTDEGREIVAKSATPAAAPVPVSFWPQTSMLHAGIPDPLGASPQQQVTPQTTQAPIDSSAEPPDVAWLLSGAPSLPSAQTAGLSAAHATPAQSSLSASAAGPGAERQATPPDPELSQSQDAATATPGASPMQSPTGSIAPAPSGFRAGQSARPWPWALIPGGGGPHLHNAEAPAPAPALAKEPPADTAQTSGNPLHGVSQQQSPTEAPAAAPGSLWKGFAPLAGEPSQAAAGPPQRAALLMAPVPGDFGPVFPPAQDLSGASPVPAPALAMREKYGSASPPSWNKSASSSDSGIAQVPSPMPVMYTSEEPSAPVLALASAAAAPADPAVSAAAPSEGPPGPSMVPEAAAPASASPAAAPAEAGSSQSSSAPAMALALAATAAALEALPASAAGGPLLRPCMHRARAAPGRAVKSAERGVRSGRLEVRCLATGCSSTQ